MRTQSRASGSSGDLSGQATGRELPPGFGMVIGGIRHYPMGDRGGFVRLAGVRLTDYARIARLLADTLPAGSRLDRAVMGFVRSFLDTEGDHALTQRMLEGGLTFRVTVGKQRHEVTVSLDLGDTTSWAHVAEANPESEVPGERNHGAVEANHEEIAGNRRTVRNERDLTVAPDVTTPFGALPNKAFSAGAGIAVSGSSSDAFTHGHDVVSAAKRYAVVKGRTAYFDFPEATLITRVQRIGDGGPASERRLKVGARAGFP